MERNSTLENNTRVHPVTNVSSEDDEHKDMYQGSFNLVADVPPIVLAIFIVTINTMVLLLMAKKKHLRSITNLLLCSLAVSDLLTGLVAVPMFLMCNHHIQLATCITEEMTARFISALIVCHLMAVTTDRYLAIVHPLRYSTLVTKPRCVMVILLIWLLSAVTSLLQFTWLDPIHHDPHEGESDQFRKKELIYDIAFIALYFLFPVVSMIFSYVRIIFEIIRQSRNIQQHSTPGVSARRNRNHHERKAIVIFAAMILLYVVCWLPYFGIRRFDMSEAPLILLYCILWLRYLASFLNPCMYIFGKQDFRKIAFDNFRRLSDIKLELNFTSTSKSNILKATLATSGVKSEKINMKSFPKVNTKN